MIETCFEEVTWRPTPERPTLDHNEVHLWKMKLDLPLIRHLRETLSLKEMLHAERMVCSVETRRFISGCGQLRRILGSYLQTEPAKIQMSYALNGEPTALKMPHTLSFDWVHADGLGLVAISSIPNVSLELEPIREEAPFETLADHFFEPHENWSVRTSRDNARFWEFYRTWTGREAFRRAADDRAKVREFTPVEGFAAAVAASGEDWYLRCFEW